MVVPAKNYGKSQCSMGKLTINGQFSMGKSTVNGPFSSYPMGLNCISNGYSYTPIKWPTKYLISHYIYIQYIYSTLWLLNIAMENGP